MLLFFFEIPHRLLHNSKTQPGGCQNPLGRLQRKRKQTWVYSREKRVRRGLDTIKEKNSGAKNIIPISVLETVAPRSQVGRWWHAANNGYRSISKG